MSIGGIVNAIIANTLITIKGDVSDLKSKLKELQGEEKKTAEAVVKSQEARTASFEKWKQTATQMNVYLQAAQTAVAFLGDAWKDYEKAANKAGGAEAERAAKFRSALNEWSAAMGKATIEVGKAVASHDELVHSLARIATGIGKVASASKDFLGSLPGGDALGWLKDHSPVDPLSYAEKGVSGIGKGFDYVTDSDSSLADQITEFIGTQRIIAGEQEKDVRNAVRQAIIDATGVHSKYLGGGRSRWTAAPAPAGPEYDWHAANAPKKSGGGGGYEINGQDRQDVELRFDQGWRDPGPLPAGALGGWSASLGDVGRSNQDNLYSSGPVGGDVSSWVAKAQADLAAMQKEHKQSVLESVFGPQEEFDAYAEKMSLLGDAVGVFSGALESGFQAWANGSATAAQAFRLGLGQMIGGIASMLFSRGKQHGLEAIGSLAFQDYRGAAMHGAAAAAYFGGAVVVGGISRSLGGSGGGGGGGSGGGGGGGGGATSVIGGGGSSQSSSTTIIYAGDGMGPSSPRFERQRAKRLYSIGRRETSSSEVVRRG